jgi:hypothetical protein
MGLSTLVPGGREDGHGHRHRQPEERSTMRHRILERAAAAGVALSLLAATTALADTVVRDADSVAAGAQSTRDLGDVAPSASVDAQVVFIVDCGGTQHVDRGQGLEVRLFSATAPDGGAVAMDPVVLGPVPETWPVDGQECAGSEVPIAGIATVTVTAPPTPGAHAYPLLFELVPSPAGSGDGSAASGSTAVTLFLDVVVDAGTPNTPPSLVLPGAMTVVADGPTGWAATYAVSATDAEDDPDPVPVCTPAAGAVLPLGTTTVACAVTDSGGLSATGSFDVTVEAAPSEPDPIVATTADFGPPVKADGLDGRVGRTIPMKVRLMAGDVAVGEGSLALVVAPCAGGDPVAELVLDWRAGSERWFGLLRTRGLEAGCYAVRAVHDGVDVGGFELRLFDHRPAAAKDKAAAAKAKAPAARTRAAERTADRAATAAPGRQGGKAKGRP